MAGCKIGRFPYMMGKLRRIRAFPFSNLLSVISVIVASAQRSDVSFWGFYLHCCRYHWRITNFGSKSSIVSFDGWFRDDVGLRFFWFLLLAGVFIK